ncbi:SusD/RagB family nutrient-binding outer membrane lipoprotein [Rubrivirga sp.]|uniref:SusD/RagB family nutrient-binding outer membrane lipoprotein n=1 Tax=Rubrivirga sp. TaxID=1885344 RepID=UPI003B51C30D
MNRFLKWAAVPLVALGTLALPACDNFGDLNVDPTEASQIDADFKITDLQLRIAGNRYENWRAQLIYSSTMMQHLAALPTYWSGDKYLYNAGYSSSLWDTYYNDVAKNIVDLEIQVCDEGTPADVNYCAVARVLRVVTYQRITDMYGDAPYFEAGRGFVDGNITPVYDRQEAIYDDMLMQLEMAAAAFDAGQPAPTGDLMFDGDIDQWRRYANSMMLRLGMRLSEVDPGKAQEWVQKAISGGVMQSNADIARVRHDGDAKRNGIAEVFDADGNQHLSETFVTWMTERGDPRLTVLGELQGGMAVGLPNGFTATTIQADDSWVDCDSGATPCGTGVYMDVNPSLVNFDDPMFLQTYAEVEFMLAEAAIRGWGASDPESHYQAGVRAAMNHLALYGGNTVDADEIEDYLEDNPYDAANGLAQIGYEYWVATFFNEYEAFANWRRTGYPNLTPVNFPGNVTGGTIPRRLRYNESESVSNTANYNEAVSRQGGDLLTTRVWWDQ